LQERLAREHPEVPAYRNGLAESLGNLAYTELFARRPREAIAAASRSLKIDPSQVWIRTNLAHGYLFDNQYEKALAIYTENKDIKLTDGRTFAEAVLADFKELRAKGLDHPNMAKIERLLRGAGAEYR
ncbi:MAG: hypothetical protein U1F42_10500, partial [Candidatus Competibacteraceae bacterium]